MKGPKKIKLKSSDELAYLKKFQIAGKEIKMTPEGIDDACAQLETVMDKLDLLNNLAEELDLQYLHFDELEDLHERLESQKGNFLGILVPSIKMLNKEYVEKLLQHIQKRISKHIVENEKKKNKKLSPKKKIEKFIWLGSEESLVELFIQLANKNWIKNEQKKNENTNTFINIDWILITDHFALKVGSENISLSPVQLAAKYEPSSAILTNKKKSETKKSIKDIEWLEDETVLIDLYVELCKKNFIEHKMQKKESNPRHYTGGAWSQLAYHFIINNRSKNKVKPSPADLSNNYCRMKRDTYHVRSNSSSKVDEVIDAIDELFD